MATSGCWFRQSDFFRREDAEQRKRPDCQRRRHGTHTGCRNVFALRTDTGACRILSPDSSIYSIRDRRLLLPGGKNAGQRSESRFRSSRPQHGRRTQTGRADRRPRHFPSLPTRDTGRRSRNARGKPERRSDSSHVLVCPARTSRHDGLQNGEYARFDDRLQKRTLLRIRADCRKARRSCQLYPCPVDSMVDAGCFRQLEQNGFR